MRFFGYMWRKGRCGRLVVGDGEVVGLGAEVRRGSNAEAGTAAVVSDKRRPSSSEPFQELATMTGRTTIAVKLVRAEMNNAPVPTLVPSSQTSSISSSVMCGFAAKRGEA